MSGESVKLFEERGWIRDGKHTDEGLAALAEVLVPLPTIWGGGKWGPVFNALMGKVVPFALELVVVQGRRVLLTWREFEGTAGWHTPGSYANPGEDWQQTASRIARRELGCDVMFQYPIGTFNNPGNPRFHDLTVLGLCTLVSSPEKQRYDPYAGAPKVGQFQWFYTKPADILPVHDKYWPAIGNTLLY